MTIIKVFSGMGTACLQCRNERVGKLSGVFLIAHACLRVRTRTHMHARMNTRMHVREYVDHTLYYIIIYTHHIANTNCVPLPPYSEVVQM